MSPCGGNLVFQITSGHLTWTAFQQNLNITEKEMLQLEKNKGNLYKNVSFNLQVMTIAESNTKLEIHRKYTGALVVLIVW